ncbi:adhesion G-protein coupled receptor D2 [Anguilla anguilla]|uniref:adhesion G-protein coupled receptor D2 n=1 Tax=Anguilla anguilla TaxID=7936 RepID=UPI0015AE9706|nr:adhesion G-protein coupled receptor D2 [Anguilla anguilla]
MQWFKIIYSNIFIWFHHCTAKDSALPLQGRNISCDDESYYEYVPDRLQWHDARQVCQKKSGALATVSSAFENMELINFFHSLNITQQVWIEGMVLTPKKDAFGSLILQFSGKSNRKHARLLQQFPGMQSVTVCVHIQFDPSCYGFSTVFSYSIPSFINEFQLRANVVRGKPIQLALMVHGLHGPYSVASANDGLWHFVCVSWTRDKGEWVVAVDGLVVGQGDNLNSSADIGRDGQFIIGQEQDTFGGSFRSDESFSGNITWLNIWDRVLNISEIHALERECSLILPGLFYKWDSSTLEIERSLRRHWGIPPCRGKKSEQHSQDLYFLTSYHNFTSVQNFVPKRGECVTFDPMSGSWDLDFCVETKGAVCQFDKDSSENQQRIFNFPKTPLFNEVSNDPLARAVMEEEHFNVTPENYFNILSKFGKFLLGALEVNPGMVTPVDMLYLAQVIELAAEAEVSANGNTSEAMLSFATNYLKLASELIDPKMSARWLDLAEEGVAIGPFNVVESIDKLTGALADALSAEGKSFTLSTKNIDVHLEPRQLSQPSCSCSYKPSTFGGHANSQDEILVPDTEVSRLQSLGYKEVMFIHVYYSHLVEVQSKVHRKPSEVYNEDRSLHTGRLATAVISATVRDFSRSQNIPVAVHYTLSSSDMVEYSWLVKPVCVFWNFSLMTEDQDGWSSEGCQVTYSGSMVTSCFCNHTTNFAVLMNYMGSKWSPEEQSVLTKLTFIGSGASLCALVVTLMLFTVLDIPKSDRMSIHKNLFAALTAAQIVLLCSGAAVGNKVACTLVAALLHLFFMAAFSWMLVEGLLLWSKVVTVNLSEERHMKYYYLIGWGLPILIVTITLASASGKYSADGHCWLSVHNNGVIWGFVGPVIFIMMVNIMVLTRVVIITISMAKRRSIMLAVNSSPMEQAYEHIRSAVKAVLVLLPILGLTWLCGVLVPFSIVIAYIFILLNSLQGLFIFLIYGVYNTEVRSTINRIKERRRALNFSNCASSRPSSSMTSSRPASSPVPGLQSHSQEEGGYRTSTSHLSSFSAPLDKATVLCESSTQAVQRQLSIPSASGSQEDEGPSPATLDLAPKESTLSKTVDGTQGGCNLHVPMEVEFISCFPLSSKPSNACGGLYLD